MIEGGVPRDRIIYKTERRLQRAVCNDRRRYSKYNSTPRAFPRRFCNMGRARMIHNNSHLLENAGVGAPGLLRYLCCPACGSGLQNAFRCATCGKRARGARGIVDFIGDERRERAGEEVTEFYQKRPFPGYVEGDSAQTLIDRCKQSPFLDALDRAIPAGASVLDCGCGTGQLAAYVALRGPRRSVVAVDACSASLQLAEGFRAGAGMDNLLFVRGDLFQLPVLRGSFEIVVCRGVVHHTPRWEEAVANVGKRVAPGGFFILGFYESAGRLAHRARRALSRAAGKPIVLLDPVLRRRDLDAEKKLNWIADQYQHPLEKILPIQNVARVLKQNGFSWIRSIPPANDTNSIFAPTPEPGMLGMLALRASFALRGLRDEDAGLVCVVARRSA